MEGGGGEARTGSGRQRLTLLDQMSAIADGGDLSGLTLEDILGSRKRGIQPPPLVSEQPIQPGRTLLDIIRDEDPKASSCKEYVGNRDRKSWRSFKDRLRLKRTGSGAAWTSSVRIPTSDILSPSTQSQLSRRSSVQYSAEPAHEMIPLDDAPSQGFRPQISLSRRTSCRFGPSPSFASYPALDDDVSDDDNNNNGHRTTQVPTLRPQISRRHSTRSSPVIEDSVMDATEPPPPMSEGSRRLSVVLAEERSLSAREAVAAQEAAEAAAAGAAAAAAGDEAEPTEEAAAAAPEAEAGPQPARMSLMDLLEETDRQMGLVGSRYVYGDDDEEEYAEEEDEEEDAGVVERNCCVCMVRHKGAAFIPCGHTFCRLCSRELWVSRGNCPLCNGFILEILDIF